MTDTKSSAGDNAIREYLAGAAPERFAIGDERTNRRTAVTIPMTKSKRNAARNTRFAVNYPIPFPPNPAYLLG